jgi:ribosomal protein S17
MNQMNASKQAILNHLRVHPSCSKYKEYIRFSSNSRIHERYGRKNGGDPVYLAKTREINDN